MSELTNRLRGLYPVGPNNEFGTRSFADFIPPISIEAANRIDELEAVISEIQDVEIHYQGAGCGLEDRNITDRYEAMAYGFERAMEKVCECIPED